MNLVNREIPALATLTLQCFYNGLFSTRALSTAGMLRFMGKVENVITKQVQQKMPETDSWFGERSQQVEALQVKKI